MTTARQPHPYSIGIGPGPFAFPHPSALVSTPGPIASVDSGLHPDTLRVIIERIASNDNFQNTRGILRLLGMTAHFLRKSVQTDVAPPEAAQEGAQRGWRLDRAAQGAGRPPGAQHIGVVDAVAPSQRRRHQRHHLVARVRPPRGIAQVEALPDEFGQAEVPRQGGRKEQPGIGHQAAVVEGDLDAVGVVCVAASIGCSFSGAVFFATKPLSQKHRSTFLPLQDANPTPSFGGFGLSRETEHAGGPAGAQHVGVVDAISAG